LLGNVVQVNPDEFNPAMKTVWPSMSGEFLSVFVPGVVVIGVPPSGTPFWKNPHWKGNGPE
jgi:hypothetical protein